MLTGIPPKNFLRTVHVADHDATLDGMYLRIMTFDNEHIGQLIACMRMTDLVPPWSEKWDLINKATTKFACLPVARHAPGNRPALRGNAIDRERFCK